MIDFTENETDVFQKAIETYGEQSQIDIAIEEMSELIKALLKERRETKFSSKAVCDICEEIADVLITVEQLILIFDFPIDDVETCVSSFVKIKSDRLERRLKQKIFDE